MNHGHLTLRKEWKQLSKAFTQLNETYQKLHVSIKKNAFVSHVLPVVSYGSALRMPSKKYPRLIEKLKRKAVGSFLGPNGFNYKGKLVILKTLPLSIYWALHVIFLFAKMMSHNIQVHWLKYMSRLDYGGIKTSQTRKINAGHMGLKK